MTNQNTEKSIDQAIVSCESMEERSISFARRILNLVLMLTVTLIILLGVVFIFPFLFTGSFGGADTVLYVFLAIYTLTFSVLMAIYRLHINEAAKLQHHKVGFMRIRVAGNNTAPGYQGEVRESLTKNAFEYVAKPGKKEKIDSPVPGHPASELTTAVLNKILDGIEVVAKKEKKGA